jgi:hypothetical protein
MGETHAIGTRKGGAFRFLFMLAVGLGSEGCAGSDSPGSSGLCSPGDTRACLGSGRCEGAQFCSSSGWGPCECDAGSETGGSAGKASGASGGAGAEGTGAAASSSGGAAGALSSGGTPSAGQGGGAHPCGDTDSDPWNCGECGHECPSKLDGSCELGSCQPGRIDCMDMDAMDTYRLGTTCADVCASIGGVCSMACGSSGISAYVVFEDEAHCQEHDRPVGGERDCDTPIQWWGEQHFFRCCCDE